MIEYMIYLLAFVIGSIAGLLYSYKKHGEPYIIKGLEVPALIISIIGWILLFNCYKFIIPFTIGFFLVGFVIGERPGYGRGETVIGLVVGAISYGLVSLLLMLV